MLTETESSQSMANALWVTVVYACANLFLSIVLAIGIYIYSKKSAEQFKFFKFLTRLWKLRGVFTPLIIHIYDTSTDAGVLYEWYVLAEVAKNDNKIKSINMKQFFWIAMGFMIAYRFVLGLAGITYAVAVLTEKTTLNHDKNFLNSIYDHSCSNCLLKVLFWAVVGPIAGIIGFIGGVLEFGIFVAIYIDQTTILRHAKDVQRQAQWRNQVQAVNSDGPVINENNYNNNKSIEFCAQETQKAFQFAETALESFPEAFMQLVFIIKTYNDPYLSENASTSSMFVVLLYVSIFASILSIANKYIWIDSYYVYFYAQSSIITKQNIIRNICSKLEIDKKDFQEIHMDYTKRVSDWTPDYFHQFFVFAAQEIISHLFAEYHHAYWQKSASLCKQSNNNTNISIVTDNDFKSILINSNCFKISQAKLDEQVVLLRYHHTSELFDESVRVAFAKIVQNILLSNKNENCIQELLWRIHHDKLKYNWSMKQCGKNSKYYLCFGFVIRSLWRVSAITNRLIVISLTWVVLGIAFELIIFPSIMIVWLVVFLCYMCVGYRKKIHVEEMNEFETCVDHDNAGKHVKTSVENTNVSREEVDPDNVCDQIGSLCHQGTCLKRWFFRAISFICVYCVCLPCTLTILLTPLIVCFLIFQVGIIINIRTGILSIRIVENIVVMAIITLFAANDTIDCNICTGPQGRQIYSNPRIFEWIVTGWISIFLHGLLSVYVRQFVDQEKIINFDELIVQCHEECK